MSPDLSARLPAAPVVKASALTESAAHSKQRDYLLSAVLVCAFIGGDFMGSPEQRPSAIGIRLLWATSLLLGAVIAHPSSRAVDRLVMTLGATGSSLFYGALVMVKGGDSSAYLHWLPALPIAVVIVLRNEPLAAFTSSAAAFLMGFMILQSGGRSNEYILDWSMCVLGSAALATLTAAREQQRQTRYQKLKMARDEAHRALEESEERRRQSERLATVGQLAAGVAHEVNNPLSFVRANLHYALEELGRSDANVSELREALSDAETGTVRIASIVQDLKTFARGGQEVLEAVEPTQAIRHALRLAAVRFKAGIEVMDGLPESLPSVQASEGRLVQVILNLLVNAADAFETQPHSRPKRIWLEARLSGERLHLVVEDNGPGIPLEVRRQLFAPFFTTKAPGQGTGLGLALSREYVQRFGGDLVLEQGERGGARFRIELPLSDLPRAEYALVPASPGEASPQEVSIPPTSVAEPLPCVRLG